MQINLIQADGHSITLEWDQAAGVLTGDNKLIQRIQRLATWALEQGYWQTPVMNWNYPIKQPLQDATELALLLASLDYYSDGLPLPEPAANNSDIEVIY